MHRRPRKLKPLMFLKLMGINLFSWGTYSVLEIRIHFSIRRLLIEGLQELLDLAIFKKLIEQWQVLVSTISLKMLALLQAKIKRRWTSNSKTMDPCSKVNTKRWKILIQKQLEILNLILFAFLAPMSNQTFWNNLRSLVLRMHLLR